MKYLSQRDPLWASVKLGNSSSTVGRYGCTTTCLSMSSDYFGIYKNPGVMAKIIRYTSGGYIIWGSLPSVGLKLVERIYGRNDMKIEEALRNPKKTVILQVENVHWVLATSTRLLGGYNIADPWFGDKSNTGRYGHKITGCAIISKL